jgi:hypothetical protein
MMTPTKRDQARYVWYRSFMVIRHNEDIYQIDGLPTTWSSLGAAQAYVDILRRTMALAMTPAERQEQ